MVYDEDAHNKSAIVRFVDLITMYSLHPSGVMSREISKKILYDPRSIAMIEIFEFQGLEPYART